MSAGVLLWILGWNVAAFCLMGVDKWKAKHGDGVCRRRFSFCLPWPGGAWAPCWVWAFSATRPATGPFSLGMPAILILQVAALTAWTYWDVFLR